MLEKSGTVKGIIIEIKILHVYCGKKHCVKISNHLSTKNQTFVIFHLRGTTLES